VDDSKGSLVTCPSTSPENTYLLDNGEESALCYRPTMDSQILRQLWAGFLDVSDDVKGANLPISKVLYFHTSLYEGPNTSKLFTAFGSPT